MKILTLIIAAILLGLFAMGAAYAADDDMMYGIGSVSKVFGAAAVMKLVDDGLVNLDKPLVTYIHDFRMADQRYVDITPRMLLNHSSGLMGSTNKDSWLLGDTNPRFIDEFLQALSRQRLKHNPGERSIYCNDGFTLAEILTERVSGMSLANFIEQNFLSPMGIKNIKTPSSDFDRRQLADIYLGNIALQPENLHHIASGGMYSSMEDLCRFAEIFMNSADGAILSGQSVNEMAKNQHKMEMLLPSADKYFSYGLGWDSVDLYPFNRLGIKALSKGGQTMRYNTDLTVLPDYNIAVAVSSSGSDSHAAIIAQEIILAVLIEEGLLRPGDVPEMPGLNLEQALIPGHVKDAAGIYGGGGLGGAYKAGFTDHTLALTPVASIRERQQEFLYNTDGVFVSTNGDYLGRLSSNDT
jgi:CubicO group peptidase (beta-lactamase class C family)